MSTKPNYKLRKTVLGTASVLTGFVLAGAISGTDALANERVIDTNVELSPLSIASMKGSSLVQQEKPEILPMKPKVEYSKGTGLVVDKPELKAPTAKGTGVTETEDKSELHLIPNVRGAHWAKTEALTQDTKPEVTELKGSPLVQQEKPEAKYPTAKGTGLVVDKPELKAPTAKGTGETAYKSELHLIPNIRGAHWAKTEALTQDTKPEVTELKGSPLVQQEKPEAKYPTAKGTGLVVDKPELKAPTAKGTGETAYKSELHLIPNIRGAHWAKTEALIQDAKPEVTGLKGSPLVQEEKPEAKYPTAKGTGLVVDKPELKAPTAKGTGVTVTEDKSELHLIPNIHGAYWAKTEALIQGVKPEITSIKGGSLKVSKPTLPESLVAKIEKGFGETAYKSELHLIPNIHGAHWAKTEALTQDNKTELPEGVLLALTPEKPELVLPTAKGEGLYGYKPEGHLLDPTAKFGVYQNEELGITVKLSGDDVNANLKLSASKVSRELTNSLFDEDHDVFEIHFKDINGNERQITSPATVTIRTRGYVEAVYHVVPETGLKEKLEILHQDGNSVTFKVAHFSKFAVVYGTAGADVLKNEGKTEVVATSTPQAGVLALTPEKPELKLDTKVSNKENKSGKIKETKAEGKVLPKTTATGATAVTLPAGLAAALVAAGLISLRRKNN